MWSEEVHCLAASTSIFLLWAQTVSVWGFAHLPPAHFSPGTRDIWAEVLRDRDVLLLAHSPLDLLCVILFSVSLSSLLFLLVLIHFSWSILIWHLAPDSLALPFLRGWGLVSGSSDFAAGAEVG